LIYRQTGNELLTNLQREGLLVGFPRGNIPGELPVVIHSFLLSTLEEVERLKIL